MISKPVALIQIPNQRLFGAKIARGPGEAERHGHTFWVNRYFSNERRYDNAQN